MNFVSSGNALQFDQSKLLNSTVPGWLKKVSATLRPQTFAELSDASKVAYTFFNAISGS